MSPEILQRTVVWYHIGGTVTFLIKRELAGFTREKILPGPTPGGDHAIKTVLQPGVDEQHCVAFGVDAGFEEQWGVDHESRNINIQRLELTTPTSIDHRVKDGFQPFTLGFITEDDSRDRGSIGCSIDHGNSIAPPLLKQ